jgi:ABC-type branched-subunit amino acid transport system ATPase component/ABC-type branched-subunit amino acid transport system permease subunit
VNTLGEIMVGVTYGLQYGLLALGLVLVWRASRFVNFAHGQMGVLGSLFMGWLVLEQGLPYWFAIVCALLFGALFAALLEYVFVRKLEKAPRLVLLIASIGIAQTAFGFGTFDFDFSHIDLYFFRIPFFHVTNPFVLDLGGRGYPVPLKDGWTIGSVGLSSAQVVTLVVAPLAVVALQLLFTRTELGKTIRAAAANPEAARLSGISVRRTSTIVWVIAGVLSTLTAILQAPQISGLDVSNLGPTLLVRGLAAALLGGMTDFRKAFAAGIALGVVENEVLFHVSAQASNTVVFLAILLGVLLQGRNLARGVRAGDDRVSEPIARQPLTERLREVSFARNVDRYGWGFLVLVLLVLPQLPGLTSQGQAYSLVLVLSFAIVTLGITLLTGWAGQISLGHVGLLGVGAYSAAAAAGKGWGLPVVLLYAGVITALVAVPVGLPALRYRGLFLAVTTLGFAVVAPTYLFRIGVFGEESTGNARLPLDSVRIPFAGSLDSKRQLYYVALGVLLLVVASLTAFRRSGPGRALLAVRDNEATAAAHGLPPYAVKLVALAMSGFIAGLGGAVWAMANERWNYERFDPNLSLVVLGIAIVGGLGSLYGPVVGAFMVLAAPSLYQPLDTIGWRAFFSGALVLNVLLFLPGGVTQAVERLRTALLRAMEKGLPAQPFGPVEGAHPLVVRDVRIAFGGIQAVDGVSLEVHPREIVGLIGGNGAGKSTLMNLISGHATPDSGEIEVFGQQVAGLPPEYRPALSLARTFQDARLYPGLTVLETVLVALDRTDRSGTLSALVAAPWTRAPERSKRQRAAALLERVGLADKSHVLVSELSTGMRRLLDVATVMAGEPGLVLLDEPTAGIAQREVEQFAPLLRSLRDELGCAIVIVEHDMPLLLSLCDRVYCLENGAVIAHGTPDEVRNDPLVVASYLGTDPDAVARSGSTRKPRTKKVLT